MFEHEALNYPAILSRCSNSFYSFFYCFPIKQCAATYHEGAQLMAAKCVCIKASLLFNHIL